MSKELGNWRWYFGSSEDDDEMCQCDSRAEAIDRGQDEIGRESGFWIVEARQTIEHEELMADGTLDAAPFAESRNGEWITK